MRFTQHRFRRLMGVPICAVGVVLLFSPGSLFHQLANGAAWLLIGGMFYFADEFNLTLKRHWFTLALGLLIAGAGFVLTLGAIFELFGPRPHGLLMFYEFIGIGPLLLTTGVLVAFDEKKSIPSSQNHPHLPPM